MGLVSNVSKRHGFPQSLKLAQLLDRPLVLEQVEGRDGENGVFYILHLSDGRGNNYVTLSGHTNILPILDNLEPGDLPATVMFEQRGNAFFMVDVDEPIATFQEEVPIDPPAVFEKAAQATRASREATAPRKVIKSSPAKPAPVKLARPVYEDEDLPF